MKDTILDNTSSAVYMIEDEGPKQINHFRHVAVDIICGSFSGVVNLLLGHPLE